MMRPLIADRILSHEILSHEILSHEILSHEILSHEIDDYPDGIIIPVDKPYRWTSADVIRKIKFAACRHFGKKNLKVGHAGTLDPLATGVLLVCIGKATKLAEDLQSHNKEYIAEITFGATTPSYDLEKEIDRHFPYAHITEKSIKETLTGFVGEQQQVAPLFSAKSVDGVRAYELARRLYKESCKTDECSLDDAAESLLRVSKIIIHEAELIGFYPHGQEVTSHCPEVTSHCSEVMSHCQEVSKASSRINVTDNTSLGLPQAVVRITCSKGTYIRAFARDLGESLGSGAHLSNLIRSRSGDFRIGNALSVEDAITLLSR